MSYLKIDCFKLYYICHFYSNVIIIPQFLPYKTLQVVVICSSKKNTALFSQEEKFKVSKPRLGGKYSTSMDENFISRKTKYKVGQMYTARRIDRKIKVVRVMIIMDSWGCDLLQQQKTKGNIPSILDIFRSKP